MKELQSTSCRRTKDFVKAVQEAVADEDVQSTGDKLIKAINHDETIP